MKRILVSPQNEPNILTANVSRLQKTVGFHPKIELKSGLEETIHWWKKSSLGMDQ